MIARLLAVLLLAFSLHAAGPRVAPELPLSPADTIPALGIQSSPAIASRGEEAFAVWTDTRDASYGSLIGSRVADDGTFLDPRGILIDADAGADPRIVWTGSEYLVVSGSHRWSPYGYLNTYSHRLKPDGTPTGERIALGPLTDVRLYSNGREVVMTATKPGEAFIAFLDEEGRIRKTVAPALYPAGSAMVPDGDDWILFRPEQSCNPGCGMWIKQTRLRDGRVDSEHHHSLALNFLPYPLTAASNGDGRFLIAWDDVTVSNANRKAAYDGTFRYMVVDRDGKVINLPRVFDRMKAEFSTDVVTQQIQLHRPDATWFDGHFVVTWKWFDGGGRMDVRTIAVRHDGTTDTKDPLIVQTNILSASDIGRTRPVVTATSSRLHFLWPQAFPDQTWRTFIADRPAASLAELALPFEPIQQTTSASRQSEVEAAAGDDAMFLVWTETGETHETLRGRIVRYDGRESPVLTISTGEDAATPAVAYGGGVWLVAWTEDMYRTLPHKREKSGLHRLARRYDGNGNPLDAAPIVLSSEAFAATAFTSYHHQKMSIASSGSEFFVAWSGVGAYKSRQLRSARIAVDGTLLDPQLRYISGGDDAFHGEPHAIWTGSDYFLLWREIPLSGGSLLPKPNYARAIRLSTTGDVTGDLDELITTGAANDIERSPFEAAANGKTMLVTWAERLHYSRGCVYAQEFTFDGAAVGPKREVICGTGHGSIPPRAFGVWDGTRFQVIYSFQDVMWAAPADRSGPPGELFRGTGLLTAWRPIATPLGIVLPYTRSATELGALPRAFRRTVSFDPPRRRATKTP